MPRDKRGEKPEWCLLDNAGVLYSVPQKEKYSVIYRFSAMMVEQVDRDALQWAMDKTTPRFLSFGAYIKKGAFRYYFESNNVPGPSVKEDISNPCQPVCFREDNGWLARFYYYEKCISMEVLHAISDGGGALVFFKTLLAVYLRELGYSIPNIHGILDVAEEPRRAEREDAYGRYATARPRREKRGEKAYRNNGMAEPFYTSDVTTGFCSVAWLKEKVRGHGVPITEYPTAAPLKAIADEQHRERPRRERPVALAIPINPRGWLPLETLRNLILTVRPFIDPSLGKYTFEEVLSQVHHYLRLNISRQQVQVAIAGNVKLTTNRLLRIVPIVLKNPVISLGYKLAGVLPYSSTYTNPGPSPVPEEMAPHIHHTEVILGQATMPQPHCTPMSYGDITEITFAGTQKESDTERDLFRLLVREGVPVKVESNRTE